MCPNFFFKTPHPTQRLTNFNGSIPPFTYGCPIYNKIKALLQLVH